ncbi:MAG TPA: pitrilysin family protein [Verrucomicrobiota bacterium]|jgi:zinc protease|nr:insulinase family protein [Verrucomicrobiota bacterium]OQC25572.1 MAG: Protease 3 precursor [Verrucomicrobia bacterium ADurb.Bin063]HRR64278.1 pitrilysin family protein [Candidatus Paceibacterota bacterium]MBP8014542.1 insulinase family protein [Verrucomicrobiota bacterium]MDI9372863.1 pitrilysin family protein [Verrucomicrobiota bacterium]
MPTDSSSADPLPAIPPGVTLTTLENGLTIIVREDHSAPVVSAQAWCMAGSIHEGRWLGAGLSHVLEHMLFKGTTTRPGSRIDQEVQEAGGYMNAYTSFDRTVYHIDAPNTGAPVALDVLCDVMQNATLPPDELAREQQVILREMDMNTDDPARRASRRLFETVYTRSPYRFTVIGYPDIFNELKPEDIRGYYHEKYAPNNVFYVVVGDVKPGEVVAQIGKAYAKTKARALPPVVLPVEPKQAAPREICEEAPIELGHVHLAWHIPELLHPDVPALDVLAALLGHGRSSRLYQSVREKQGLAHSVEAWTYSPGLPGLFGLSAVVDADKFTAARAALLAEVEQMKAAPVPAAELAKAVKQFVSATLSARKTMQGQAQDLGGSWLVANDLNFSQRYLAAVQRVNPADLQRVAREYLTPENRTLYSLLPAGAAPRPAITSETSCDYPVQKFDLPNGLRLLVKEDHRLPFVEFRAVFRGGVLAETPETNGLTQLTGKLLLKGTARRSAEDIAREIESVGGSLNSYGGNNSFGVNAEVLNSDFPAGLDLLVDVLLNPTFPAPALEREREVQLAAVRDRKDHLLQSALLAMRRALFGETGYGLDALGAERSLRRLQVADLRAFHERFARPNNCVLAIYGDVQTAPVRAAVERAFAAWKAAPLPALNSGPRALDALQRVTETRDKKQAVLVIGYRGVTLQDADRYPLDLLHEACSDLGSRLFLRIREQLGLAYYVGALNVVGLAPGYFAFYAGTAPDQAARVEAELLKEAELLRAEGLTAEELRRAKAKIIGQRKIARQDLGDFATATALDELYGLGHAYTETEDARYEAVTLEQLQAVAGKYLRPEALVISLVQPARP